MGKYPSWLHESKYLSNKFNKIGKCYVCGLYTNINKNKECVKCYFERLEKAGVVFCYSCGKRLLVNERRIRLCRSCRLTQLNQLIKNPEVLKLKDFLVKYTGKTKYITDKDYIKSQLIEKLKQGKISKTGLIKWFGIQGISRPKGLETLQELINQGIVGNEKTLHKSNYRIVYYLKG